MNSTKHYGFWLVLLGASILIVPLLGNFYGISSNVLLTYSVVASFLFIWRWLICRAETMENTWLQDDNADAWRGY